MTESISNMSESTINKDTIEERYNKVIDKFYNFTYVVQLFLQLFF